MEVELDGATLGRVALQAGRQRLGFDVPPDRQRTPRQRLRLRFPRVEEERSGRRAGPAVARLYDLGVGRADDPAVIAEWAPLLVAERDGDEPVAATRATSGTDVDFGALTQQLVDYLVSQGTQLFLEHEVKNLKRTKDGRWRLTVKDRSWNAPTRRSTVEARFVFVGAGGGALPLLQAAGIPEAMARLHATSCAPSLPSFAALAWYAAAAGR